MLPLPAFTDNYIWMLHDGRQAIEIGRRVDVDRGVRERNERDARAPLLEELARAGVRRQLRERGKMRPAEDGRRTDPCSVTRGDQTSIR